MQWTLLPSLVRILAAAGLITALAGPARAVDDAPAAGALVSMPAKDALQCVKAYMIAGGGYYLVREDERRLVFVRGMRNPYSLQEQITTPLTIMYERVHVEVQQAGDTTRIATYWVAVAPPQTRFEKEAVAVEEGNQDMRRSYKRAKKMARWIKSRKSPNDCY